MNSNRWFKGGFALPTVLIASVVMLTVLTVSVSSVVAIRTTLQTQYYEQLARTAGESGVAYAKACLSKNGNVPLWTDNKPLTPATDCAGNVLLSSAVDVLVVGGGGGGGGTIAGGGGGGGVDYETGYTVAPGTYTVTVGAGGTGGKGWDNSPWVGSNGSSSAFGAISTAGGGGGGGHSRTAGQNGASGGGAVAAYITPGTGVAGQGYSGGAHPSNSINTAGGGGGAGGVGADSTATVSGNGGPGIANSISGALVYYGGGGGGGARTGSTAGTGGVGGGGNGTTTSIVAGAGQVNTGGGGGGSGYDVTSTALLGGPGGTGVVIVRYPDNGSITATTTGTVSSYTSGVYKVIIFRTSGSLIVSAVSTSSCPTDPRCSVFIDGNVRSSFSVGLPTLDSAGAAVAIPNSGYVDLLRASNGEVWRTYRQPSVQAAVVPELCSGAATSSLGWSNAQLVTAQASLPNAAIARSISLTNDALAAGQMYFRRDFPVTTAGTYTLTTSTPSTSDKVDIYIDGTLVTTAQGSLKTSSVVLTAGCHTATARLTNVTIASRASSFIAALQLNMSSAPVVATDTNWRVSSGAVVDFSGADFYADTSLWTSVVDNGFMTPLQANSAWGTVQQDLFTRMISPSGGGCPGSCPIGTAYLRDSKDFYLAADAEVMVSSLCDDSCSVYVDGNIVIDNSTWSNINQQTLTLSAGVHHVGIRVSNIGVGSSGAGLSIVNKASGVVLTRTDRSWIATSSWVSTTTADIFSYEASFVPSPSEIASSTKLDALVVAGGGGGGGNCTTCGGAGGGGGGGVINIVGMSAIVGSFSVTVGAGGAGGTANGTAGGTNGSNSQISVMTAVGGGGGMGQNATAGKVGGSGGGGSGGASPAPGAGGAGTSGQGFAGGAGILSPHGGGGGGGAGGAGVTAAGSTSGNGGAGFTSYIDGTRRVFAAGGGGGTYGPSYFAGAGESGVAGNGSATGAGGAATANTGGGGGGANGNPVGGAGGAGGSGVVYIRFIKNSITVGTPTGTLVYTASDVTINGTIYTVYRFTSGTGNFVITAVN